MNTFKKELFSRDFLDVIYKYLKSQIQISNGIHILYDNELEGNASDCSVLQTAGFLAFYEHLFDIKSDGTVLRLFETIDPESGFNSVYNVVKGQSGQFDLAELGASIGMLIPLKNNIESDLIFDFCEKVSNRVISRQIIKTPGIYLKNDNAHEIDVLNGNVYAAYTLHVVDQLVGGSKHRKEISEIVEHLSERFNTSIRLGWPYSESLVGKKGLGYSLSYQATIVAWGFKLSSSLSSDLRKKWHRILWSAQIKVIEGLRSNEPITHEAPSWSRIWANTWEIDLALSSWSSSYCQRHVSERLMLLTKQAARDGISVFADRRTSVVTRTTIGSTLRKVSNFSAILYEIKANELSKI